MTPGNLFENDLTESVIGSFYEVYNQLGYGFLEHVYTAALEREFRNRGHDVGREVGVRVMYKGEDIASQRIDMIVDQKLVVEVKATLVLPAATSRQVLSYLKSTSLEIGLVLHFGLEAKFYRQIMTNDRKR